jgi:hypothetical protein
MCENMLLLELWTRKEPPDSGVLLRLLLHLPLILRLRLPSFCKNRSKRPSVNRLSASSDASRWWSTAWYTTRWRLRRCRSWATAGPSRDPSRENTRDSRSCILQRVVCRQGSSTAAAAKNGIHDPDCFPSTSFPFIGTYDWN